MSGWISKLESSANSATVSAIAKVLSTLRARVKFQIEAEDTDQPVGYRQEMKQIIYNAPFHDDVPFHPSTEQAGSSRRMRYIGISTNNRGAGSTHR